MQTATSAAQPEQLQRFARAGRQADDELRAAARRLAPHHPELAAAVAAHAATWSAIDRWVGEIGAAFAAADSHPAATTVAIATDHLPIGLPGLGRPEPLQAFASLLGWAEAGDPWTVAAFPDLSARRDVDPQVRATAAEVQRFVRLLSDDEVWALAQQLAKALRPLLRTLPSDDRRYLHAVLLPILVRLDRRWPKSAFVDPDRCATVDHGPRALGDVRRTLELSPPKREAGFGVGLANGAVLGDIDDEGYTNGWGELGRLIGQVLGGFVPVVADGRDAVANAVRGRWTAAGASAAFAVPGLGDAGRLVKNTDRSLELLDRMDELKDAERASKLFREATEGAEAWRLIGGEVWTPGRPRSSEVNVLRHFADHGRQFSDVSSPLEYAAKAHSFLHHPPGGTLTRVRANGDVVRFHPPSGTYGVMDANGTPRTLFRPRSGIRYFYGS